MEYYWNDVRSDADKSKPTAGTEIFSTGAWALADKKGGEETSLSSARYMGWVREAWEKCIAKDNATTYVAVWNNAGYRCYKGTCMKPFGPGTNAYSKTKFGNAKTWTFAPGLACHGLFGCDVGAPVADIKKAADLVEPGTTKSCRSNTHQARFVKEVKMRTGKFCVESVMGVPRTRLEECANWDEHAPVFYPSSKLCPPSGSIRSDTFKDPDEKDKYFKAVKMRSGKWCYDATMGMDQGNYNGCREWTSAAFYPSHEMCPRSHEEWAN